uniref:uncharacterized protein LOC105352584 n=1 Tax=Fragaria vesca subsp. vesca TaxID=101020 RepID=UPI0005C80691|nr:PREDICTED: uncharacterized protein LOC105352584 [Fragaria vesca subsp. vesca]
MERNGLNQPPMLKGMDFAQWKLQMRSFIYGIDFHAWRSVERGWKAPEISTDGKAPEGSSSKLKDEDDWDEKEIKLSEANHKALNALYAALSRDEKKKVQNCVTAKQVWDKLCVLHEDSDDEFEEDDELMVHHKKVLKAAELVSEKNEALKFQVGMLQEENKNGNLRNLS